MENSRFMDQCVNCSCYYENAGPGEAIDPDSECTLGEKTWGKEYCDFFDYVEK